MLVGSLLSFPQLFSTSHQAESAELQHLLPFINITPIAR